MAFMSTVLNLSCKKDWPPLSPNLNLLDYCIWCILEAIVNAKKHRSLNSLKAFILREWDKLPLKVICATVEQWHNRLSLIIYKYGS